MTVDTGASTLTTSVPIEDATRSSGWKGFWKFEAVLLALGTALYVVALFHESSLLLWWSGERSEAVILEIEQVDGRTEQHYWVRIGDRGIWTLWDDGDARRGDHIQVLFDPNHRSKARTVDAVQGDVFGGLVMALTWPLVSLVIAGVVHLVRRLRRVSPRASAMP